MISDQVSPKEQERELKKAAVTATTNPSVTDPHHKAAMETLDQETGDRMSKVDSPLRRNPGTGHAFAHPVSSHRHPLAALRRRAGTPSSTSSSGH